MQLFFDLENSAGSLLRFHEQIYSTGKNTANEMVDIMGFKTVIIRCNFKSGATDNGEDTDIFYTFNLTEPTGYMIIKIPTSILCQQVTKERREYEEFHIRDEQGRSIDFNGDVFILFYI